MEKVEASKENRRSEEGQLSSSMSISSKDDRKIDSKRQPASRSSSSSSSSSDRRHRRRKHKHSKRSRRRSSDSRDRRHRRKRSHERRDRRRSRKYESHSKSDRDRHSDSLHKSRRKEDPPKLEKIEEPQDKRPEDYEIGSMKIVEKKKPTLPTRAGGVYVPPWKMEKIANELKSKDPDSKEHQRFMWENLRKSINGLINKVNVSNIQNIILELFQENLIRGRGLLTKAIFKAQMASPNFTHVYAALIAVLNTKLPEVVKLLISRYIIQFQKAYKRNNKIVCVAAVRMLAHLVNQQVIHEVLALEILSLFLENPTEDSIEMATDFMTECGQVLGDITPQGSIAIFERFKGILHEGECNRRVQYTIESLFNTRKSRFKNHPGVISELDLIEEEDRITHEVSLTDEFDAEEKVNFFQYESNYTENNKQWEEIQKEILGEEEERINKRIEQLDDEEESSESEEEDKIEDITEQDLMNLRKTIYLVIASSVDFEEVVHKLMKLNIREGQEIELCNMIVE